MKLVSGLDTHTQTHLPKPLRCFLYVNAALFAMCVGVELLCAVWHLHSPYTWPLTPRPELQFDLLGYLPKFAQFHHDAFFSIRADGPFAYPAPMAILYWLFYLLPLPPAKTFLISAGCAVLGLTFLVYRKFTGSGLAPKAAAAFCTATLLFSYPFIFEFKQGNLEIFVWLTICAGIWLFLRGRGYAAATCFALAGSMKLFPLIYLGLHISQRKWRMVAFGLAVAIATSIAALWLVDPDIPFAWRHIQDGMAQFQAKIVLNVVSREIGFDHSLFSVVKRLLIGQVPLSGTLRIYMPLAATAGTALYFLRIRTMPVTNQVLILAVCSILLPPVSYDYTLMHLYPALVMIALLSIRGAGPPGLFAITILLAVCLAPLSELIYHGVRFGGQVRAIVLLALAVCALKFPLTSDAHQPVASEQNAS